MKKKLLVGLMATMGLGIAGTVSASDLDYQYVDVSYLSMDIDGVSGNGLALDGSFELTETLFGTVGFVTGGAEEGAVEVDSQQISAGLGGRWAITPTADFVAQVGAVRDNTELTITGFGSGEASDTGFFIGAGFRTMVSERFELNGGFTFVDIYEDNSTSWGLGARYGLTKSSSLLFGYNSGDDVDTFIIGWRFGG